MTKVFVYGIDGAAPELIFDRWIDNLPNIKKLMQNGIYARMNSTIPPATIIAWTALVSGKDPSQIGVFSYTYKDKETGNTKLANSQCVKTERIWDILGNNNKKSIILNVPLTYPPEPIKGVIVSGFLTPGIESKCAYPEKIKENIISLGNTEYYFDIAGNTGYKGLEVDEIEKRTYEMTDIQIKLLKKIIAEEDWDYMMQVFIGSDRLQHMLWRHFDKTHRKYIKDSKYKDVLKNYYIHLDKKLGEIIELIKEKHDDAIFIISSDHGMVKQEGKININNWLMEKGYLVLKKDFQQEIEDNKKEDKRTRIRYEGIDHEKSIAYGSGAYNARIFINKEKTGNEYEKIREDIIKGIKEIPDDQGNKIKTEVFKSEDIYEKNSNTECPDLTIYFDELRWASNPDFGVDGLYSWKTAVGSDNAGHSKQGIFIISGQGIKPKGDIGEIDIYQFTPTVLNLLDVPVPEDIKHKHIEVN